jgi:hypothetical protein
MIVNRFPGQMAREARLRGVSDEVLGSLRSPSQRRGDTLDDLRHRQRLRGSDFGSCDMVTGLRCVQLICEAAASVMKALRKPRSTNHDNGKDEASGGSDCATKVLSLFRSSQWYSAMGRVLCRRQDQWRGSRTSFWCTGFRTGRDTVVLDVGGNHTSLRRR